MNRIQITHDDVTDPIKLRQRLDQAYAQNDHLLRRIEAVEARTGNVEARQGTGLVTPTDRTLLNQLAVGSNASAAPASPGQVKQVATFADLPPVATARDGDIVRVRATNNKYVFDGPTRAWVAW